jgi:hypothetical protein
LKELKVLVFSRFPHGISAACTVVVLELFRSFWFGGATVGLAASGFLVDVSKVNTIEQDRVVKIFGRGSLSSAT